MGRILNKPVTPEQQELISAGKIPEHVAIIMDGNGRWAHSKGLPRFAGHRVGVQSVREIVEKSAQIGIKYLTLYTFSTENWKRPKQEVSTLMRLLVQTLKKEIEELNKNNVRLITIGSFDTLPDLVQKEFEEAKKLTENNKGLTLVLALSYSGRWEILEAVNKIVAEVKEGKFNDEPLTEKRFAKYLATAGIPDPDLLIRSSGELRISNFLLWQIAYSEIYITDTFWPDFREKELYKAIKSYQQRERRFGKVSEQIKQDEKGL